jgi:hypothetical protein
MAPWWRQPQGDDRVWRLVRGESGSMAWVTQARREQAVPGGTVASLPEQLALLSGLLIDPLSLLVGREDQHGQLLVSRIWMRR